MDGMFGEVFDFNHDGKLDGFEQAADFAAFCHVMDEAEKKEKRESSLFDDDFDDED